MVPIPPAVLKMLASSQEGQDLTALAYYSFIGMSIILVAIVAAAGALIWKGRKK